MKQYIMALDSGTTSNRCILFDKEGNMRSVAQKEFTQYFPQPGWVEHDANEIWQSQLSVAREAMRKLGATYDEIAAIGITNQRETTVVWDRVTAQPIYNAIVWQCRRTSDYADELIERGLTDSFRQKTGLVIDPYFSATKLRWILENVDGAREKAEHGDLLFGTVDTWLIWNLCGAHVTDYSNASRTMLYNIHTLSYDPVIMHRLNIPACILPEVKPSAAVYGFVKDGIEGLEALAGVPISGDAGDQQAALFGQACFEPGQAKCTYGTGGFLMMQTGDTPVASKNRLLTTIAWGVNGKVRYALEGSIFNAGSSIKWLRDEVGLISSAHEIDVLAESVPDAGGAYFVSAFTGLGAPHWDMYARGALVGVTRATNRAHIARAVLEGIVYQVGDLARTMEFDSGRKLGELKVDGGASVSDVMMQFQADMLDVPVNRPKCVESTALGAAYLAAIGVGLYKDEADVMRYWESERIFQPKMSEVERGRRQRGWTKAVEKAKNWED